jgi:hypothetical protein
MQTFEESKQAAREFYISFLRPGQKNGFTKYVASTERGCWFTTRENMRSYNYVFMFEMRNGKLLTVADLPPGFRPF